MRILNCLQILFSTSYLAGFRFFFFSACNSDIQSCTLVSDAHFLYKKIQHKKKKKPYDCLISRIFDECINSCSRGTRNICKGEPNAFNPKIPHVIHTYSNNFTTRSFWCWIIFFFLIFETPVKNRKCHGIFFREKSWKCSAADAFIIVNFYQLFVVIFWFFSRRTTWFTGSENVLKNRPDNALKSRGVHSKFIFSTTLMCILLSPTAIYSLYYIFPGPIRQENCDSYTVRYSIVNTFLSPNEPKKKRIVHVVVMSPIVFDAYQWKHRNTRKSASRWLALYWSREKLGHATTRSS